MSGDFELTDDDLRVVVRFVAEAAQDTLPHFEQVHPDDRRPRAAIEAAWEFVGGARRSRLQRLTSVEAHRAAAEARTEVARLAAQAAGDAASAAYIHPIAKATQVGHIVRPSANAARIAELESGDDPDTAESVLAQVRRRASPQLIGVLRRYPPLSAGRSRPSQLMAEVDCILRQAL